MTPFIPRTAKSLISCVQPSEQILVNMDFILPVLVDLLNHLIAYKIVQCQTKCFDILMCLITVLALGNLSTQLRYR